MVDSVVVVTISIKEMLWEEEDNDFKVCVERTFFSVEFYFSYIGKRLARMGKISHSTVRFLLRSKFGINLWKHFTIYSPHWSIKPTMLL